MYHVFYICSSVNGHLCILAIVNSAAVNTGACIFLYLFELHISFWVIVFSKYMPRSEIAGLLWPSNSLP